MYALRISTGAVSPLRLRRIATFSQTCRKTKKSRRLVAAGQARLEFSIDTASGFEPELRVDPVDGTGRFRLSELRVTCRLQAEP